ncbi:hypothetical protein [Thalassotalea ganghwensis]
MEIILIRHGKPASADNPVLNATDYTKWIRRYNLSSVSEHSRPASINPKLRSYFVLSSDFNRAIHSAEIYTGRKPDYISSLFKEVDMPRFKLPFKFKAMTWLYFCLVLWMLGLNRSFESYAALKARSENAANQLIQLAQENGKVVLFGHGYLNFHIRRALVRRGWSLKCKSNTFWGISRLET